MNSCHFVTFSGAHLGVVAVPVERIVKLKPAEFQLLRGPAYPVVEIMLDNGSRVTVEGELGAVLEAIESVPKRRFGAALIPFRRWASKALG